MPPTNRKVDEIERADPGAKRAMFVKREVAHAAFKGAGRVDRRRLLRDIGARLDHRLAPRG